MAAATSISTVGMRVVTMVRVTIAMVRVMMVTTVTTYGGSGGSGGESVAAAGAFKGPAVQEACRS